MLAERIAHLPEEVDPQALYEQLAALQRSQGEIMAVIGQKRAEQGPRDEPVDVRSLETFTASFRALLAEADKNAEIRAAIIRKLVHRIEIKKDGCEIFFYLGRGHFEREHLSEKQAGRLTETRITANAGVEKEKGGLVLSKPPTKPLQKFFSDRCSKRLENGGDGGS